MTELQPPFTNQSQSPPGTMSRMEPTPDHGEHPAKAALPHLKPGAAIINTTPSTRTIPIPRGCPMRPPRGAIQNFTSGLAQMLAEKGVRVNCVAPGPIWTPLIPATMPPEKVKQFGANTPMKRQGQPKEVAPVYVLLASDEASSVSGATVAVTSGQPML